MEIRIIDSIVGTWKGGSFAYKRGQVVSAPDDVATMLLNAGQAVLVNKPEPQSKRRETR